MREFYDGRFGSARWWHLKSNRRPEDEKGLVGFHEVTSYG
jgi:hypothetical protein